MCGLAGWIGEANLPKGQRLARARALEGLLVANAERGTDASGVCMVHHGRDPIIYKRAVDSYRLVEDEQLQALIRSNDARIALGHTRWGTMGKNTNENAHPFKEKDIIGTHNGIIWNYAELDKAMDGHKPLRVDSQVIFRLLSQVEPDPKLIVQLLPMLQGSLALAWVDERDPDALWIFRHDNPISMAIAPAAKSAFWSSDYMHLSIVMQSAYGKNWDPITIKEHTLYRFFWDEQLMFNEYPVEMPKKAIKATTTNPNFKGYKQRNWNEITNKNGPAQATNSDGNVTSLQKFIDDQFPKREPAKNLDRDIRAGNRDWDDDFESCNMCHGKVDWDDDNATWHNEGQGYMLCGPCDRWWETQGVTLYSNLGEALDTGQFGGMEAVR